MTKNLWRGRLQDFPAHDVLHSPLVDHGAVRGEGGPEDGVHAVGMFLGYWFIRKAMWASAASIKSNATSLKKFYGFMLEDGVIQQSDLDKLRDRIREGVPEWPATLARYDDLHIDDPAEIGGY